MAVDQPINFKNKQTMKFILVSYLVLLPNFAIGAGQDINCTELLKRTLNYSSREKRLADFVDNIFEHISPDSAKADDAIFFFENLEKFRLGINPLPTQIQNRDGLLLRLQRILKGPLKHKSGMKKKRAVKKLVALIQRAKKEEKISFGALQRINTNLFILTHSKDVEHLAFLFSKRKVIQERIEREIIENGVGNALQKLNILSSPGAISKFGKLRKRYKNMENTMVALALNYFILRFNPLEMSSMGSMILPFPPRIDLMRNKVVTRELIEKVKAKGLDASYDELEKYFGRSARFDAIYKQTRSFYFQFLGAFGVYLMYKLRGPLIFSLSSLFVSEEDIDKYMKDNLNIEETRQRQFEQWKQGMYDFTGKWPTPEQEKRQWDFLNTLKLEDLVPR